MNIIRKIKSLLTYQVIRPVIYDYGLLQAYSSRSVCGGTLKGKTAVVTGATSGIGYATAQRLLKEGCHVIITGRNEVKLKKAINSLTKDETTTIGYIVMDSLVSNSVKKGIEEAFKKAQIDLWVNCAGIFKKTDRNRQFRGIDADTFFEVVNTNLKSTILATRYVANKMLANGKMGQIINIASICGLTNHFGYTPYGISKTGTIEYTKLLAEEFQGKVLIEGVAPGSVATRMGSTGFGKNISGNNGVTKHTAMPEEIASVICFLASPVGKHLNGKTVIASAMEMV